MIFTIDSNFLKFIKNKSYAIILWHSNQHIQGHKIREQLSRTKTYLPKKGPKLNLYGLILVLNLQKNSPTFAMDYI